MLAGPSAAHDLMARVCGAEDETVAHDRFGVCVTPELVMVVSDQRDYARARYAASHLAAEHARKPAVVLSCARDDPFCLAQRLRLRREATHRSRRDTAWEMYQTMGFEIWECIGMPESLDGCSHYVVPPQTY